MPRKPVQNPALHGFGMPRLVSEIPAASATESRDSRDVLADLASLEGSTCEGGVVALMRTRAALTCGAMYFVAGQLEPTPRRKARKAIHG
jgi:hypothetical protein